MTYTLGVLENAIYAVQQRISGLTASGKSLEGIKQVLVGSRGLNINGQTLPAIIIDIGDGFDQKNVNTAYDASEKQTTLPLEIMLVVEKLLATSGDSNAFADNCLFDSAGNGAIAFFQKLIDAFVYDSSNIYDPRIGLNIDMIPNFRIRNWISDEKTVQIIMTVDLLIRHQNGRMSGVTS